MLNDLEEAAGAEILRKLWATISKGRDLEMQVRRGWLLDVEFIELVDFIPSDRSHHDSIRIEPRLLPDLIAQLVALHQFLTAGTAAIGKNQGQFR